VIIHKCQSVCVCLLSVLDLWRICTTKLCLVYAGHNWSLKHQTGWTRRSLIDHLPLMCQQVVSDKSENDVSYDVSFSSKVWNGKTFQKVYVSLQDPLDCVKFIDHKELGHHIRESGLLQESTVVLLPSAGLIKALNNTVSVPVNTVDH